MANSWGCLYVSGVRAGPNSFFRRRWISAVKASVSGSTAAVAAGLVSEEPPAFLREGEADAVLAVRFFFVPALFAPVFLIGLTWIAHADQEDRGAVKERESGIICLS